MGALTASAYWNSSRDWPWTTIHMAEHFKRDVLENWTSQQFCLPFASDGNSQKVAALKAAFPDREILAPAFSHRTHETAAKLLQVIEDFLARHRGDVIVVGTSMGGFWANWAAARKGLKAVIINPAITPSKTLTKSIGRVIDGKAWTQSDCDAYQGIESSVELKDREPYVVLLARNDDVIPYEPTVRMFEGKVPIVEYADGGHRFDKYDEICRHVRLIDAQGLTASPAVT